MSPDLLLFDKVTKVTSFAFGHAEVIRRLGDLTNVALAYSEDRSD